MVEASGGSWPMETGDISGGGGWVADSGDRG